MRAEIEAEWGHPLPADYPDIVNRRTVKSYATDLKIMPGLTDALDRIQLLVAVASSSYPEKLRLGLETVGIYERLMPNVISAALVDHGKPAPDIFLFAAG